MKPNKALLIIDMQKGSFTADTPIYDVEGVVYRINRLAQHFRDSDLPVIFVQHDGNGTGEFEKNTVTWELLEELVIMPTDILINMPIMSFTNLSFSRNSL